MTSRRVSTLSTSTAGSIFNSYVGKKVVEEPIEEQEVPSPPSINITAEDGEWVALNRSSIDLSEEPSQKALRVLGIKHRRSFEPSSPLMRPPSLFSTKSEGRSEAVTSPQLPLTSLYVVSGLPKSPQTWTLSDSDVVQGLDHSENALNRFWRPEILGSTVSPGVGGAGGKRRRFRHDDASKTLGTTSKQEVNKMLAKALKLSFTREVEIVASTLQPASTIHTFTFTLPASTTPLAPTPSGSDFRTSLISSSEHRFSQSSYAVPYSDDPYIKPSSAFLGPSAAKDNSSAVNNLVTYHGVCLTVWSHADAERSTAIRRTLETGRSRKESAQSLVSSRMKNLRSEGHSNDPAVLARRSSRRNTRGPWTDVDTDGETEGAISESDFEVASITHGPGESTLFLPGDTVFWLPYALTLVSRYPVYDIMRDYLTLSWARFSKDVQSHTLQISKILAYPAPKNGDMVRLDTSAKNDPNSLEILARFPGGLDFSRGLVDVNFTMWPLFKCLNVDNILTLCEIALSPTGRVLFYSRHPAMLGIAVNALKYLVELRGWNGVAHPAIHSRDAKIYIDDPGPWILGLATEMRHGVRPPAEVCVCDLDINYLNCLSPPPNAVSIKQQRDKYRQRLLSAFEPHYHPDHSIPSEFKEAFPAGRFRPVCKIQAKRGSSAAAIAEQIKAPDWWNSTRIIQAFDAVLQDRYKKPSLLRRISKFGSMKRPPRLSVAEQTVQLSIRQRATAFVDARDDLETKIGRLSRRLNFLVTESDLWRDKFITFEHYAEKLSTEANQLRTKINKEQKESKRLSGLYTLTAAEKDKLQTKLSDTENAHKEALLEMEKMRETMKRMEEERLQMVAEIEQSIEQALVSMTVGFTESDYGDSRPSSRLSSFSGTRSRRASDATRIKSFGTDSTLAESYDELKEDARGIRNSDTIEEEDEQEHSPVPNLNPKRFSASRLEIPQDTMAAVDEGISERSDKITQKVLEIQQKLEDALNAEHSTGHHSRRTIRRDSDEETVNSTRSLNRAPRHSKITNTRSGTSSTPRARTRASSQTERLAHSREHSMNVHASRMPSSIDKGDISESRTAAPLTLGIANSTDDDDGFYSASPGGFDDEDDSDGKYTKLKSTSPPSSRRGRRKERLSRTTTNTTETINDSSIA